MTGGAVNRGGGKQRSFRVGQGHGGHSNLPAIREVLPENMTDRQRSLMGYLEPCTRMFRMGKARIFLSPPTERGGVETPGWHMTISVDDRYPTWDEVAKAWYELVPEAENRLGAMLLPPKSAYVNIHDYCFQVYEIPAGGEGD